MGALMQLVAYGAQDIYLTGNNPQMTYFKSVFRRHTNFSIESIKQAFNGNISTEEFSVESIISRSRDLVSNMWIEATLPSVNNTSATATYTNWCNNTGCAFLKECEIDIGGSQIDKHNSLWNDIYNELYIDKTNNSLINKKTSNTYVKHGSPNHTNILHLNIPLHFWFTKNKGSSLPLIALQYHEVTLKCKFRALKNLVVTDNATISFNTKPSIELWVDYIFLEQEERKRFAQTKHAYLIEQLQYHKEELTSSYGNINLKFHHPVKELIWVFTNKKRILEINTENTAADPLDFSPKRLDPSGETIGSNGKESSNSGNNYFNYQMTAGTNTFITSSTSGSCINGSNYVEHFDNMKIKINGHDRFSPRNAVYFRTIQPIQANHKIPSKHIYCYTFSLTPYDYQPSGTCNFSRLDSVELEFNNMGTPFEKNDRNINVFAINYNLLQIASGLGGLVFSN